MIIKTDSLIYLFVLVPLIYLRIPSNKAFFRKYLSTVPERIAHLSALLKYFFVSIILWHLAV